MMIPTGFMAKRVVNKPDWPPANGVKDIYSVSGCISKDFANYINFWKHNGHWLFNSPEVIEQVAWEHSIDLAGTTMFYYEVYEREFNDEKELWCPYQSGQSFTTNILLPECKTPQCCRKYPTVRSNLWTCRHLPKLRWPLSLPPRA